MKKLLSIPLLGLTLLTATEVSNAATLTREYVPGDVGQGSGTSKASICTNMECTALTNMYYGSSISKIGDADGFTIIFDSSFNPGTPATFNLGPSQIATIDASPGTYVPFYLPDCDYLEVKLISPGNYVYHVSIVCQ